MERIAVGCKMPNGITLNLRKYVITDETSKQVRAEGPDATVTLRGVAYKVGKEVPPFVIGGYAITHVPLDFWAAWLDTHEDFAPLRDGLIYAEPTEARAISRSAEQAEIKAQFAPVTPQDVAGVEEADEQVKKAA